MRVELLAPVGNYEAFIGAINEGADAVYLGGSKFSARASCGVFSNEKLSYMIDYAHEYGVKVYVAFNTLIKENELEEAFNYAISLYNMGVDALIVQDVGFINLLSKVYECEIHASTQLTIHNLGGALYFKNRGIKRVVVSRELSIEDIKIISREVETEGFIHGAICVSYSGQCTMSSLISERSGNRGRCAQPCRMEYSLINKDKKEFKSGFLLSPKDLMTINILPRLLKETNIKSLKIEGRMKKGEYVVNTVKSYKDLIKKIENDEHLEQKDFEEKEHNMLRIFNREGFTNAYMQGYEGEGFLAINNPKNQGIYIGKVLSNGMIILQEDVSLGDGISFNRDGFILTKILDEKNNKLDCGKKGMKVKIFPNKFKKEDELYKTLDKNFEKNLKKSFEKEYVKKNSLNCKLTFVPNKPMVLEVYDNQDHRVKVYGETVEYPNNRAISVDRLEEQLTKGSCGSYNISQADIYYEEGCISISKINELRRSALEKYREDVLCKFHKNISIKFGDVFKKEEHSRDSSSKDFYIYVSTTSQFKAVYEKGFKNIIFSPFMYNRKIDSQEILSKPDLNIYVKFPTIIKDLEFDKIMRVFEKFRSKTKGILTSNAGVLNYFKDKNIEILGDHKLNIFNSMSVDFYKEFKFLTISSELSKNEIRHLTQNARRELGMFVYGKMDIMVSEYCPIGTFVGKRDKENECSRPCIKEDFYLKDRISNNLLLLTNINCKVNIYKEDAINLIDEIDELYKMNINNFRIDFIDESYKETCKILDDIIGGKSYKNAFKGNYYKPVE